MKGLSKWNNDGAAKKIGFTYFRGLKMPPQEEVKKHQRCSCVVGRENKTLRAVIFENDNRDKMSRDSMEVNTPHNRGVIQILKGN